jgi:hypothetical protein
MFKLIKITNQASSSLAEKGFIFARDTGVDIFGLGMSILINYIDQLIISQNTYYNNFYYFENT